MSVRPRHAGRRGFSLIEILAAVAVLGVLGLILSQVTGSIALTTKASSRVIDAAGQARLVFDRLNLDLAGLVKRKDLDFVAQNAAVPGNTPLLLFLSEVASPGLSSNNRSLSLVSYELRPHPDNKDFKGGERPCLVRSGKAIPWRSAGGVPSSGFMGLQSNGLPQSFTGTAFPPGLLPSTIQDFDVLAAGAIRIVVGFRLYPDNQPVELLDGFVPKPNNARGQTVYSLPIRTVTSSTGATTSYTDLNRVAALVVGLVVLDLESLRLVSADQVALLAKAFPAPADGDDRTPLQAWAAIANASLALPGAVPLQVRQSVRVYERTFPVTPFTTQAP